MKYPMLEQEITLLIKENENLFMQKRYFADKCKSQELLIKEICEIIENNKLKDFDWKDWLQRVIPVIRVGG